MGKRNEIILTEQELNDLKDEIRFRTMVMMTLKSLKGIPDTVRSLKTQAGFQWVLLSGIVLTIVGVALRGIFG